MNETEKPPFEISLPKDMTYEDLNKAHMADQLDGGSREEEMYPAGTAQHDNSRSYRSEMASANTRNLLEQLKSRMQPDENGESEFGIRTGEDANTRESIEKRMDKREKNFDEQDKKTAYFIDCINNTNSSDSITRERTGWLAHAEKAKDLDEINEEQFMKIQEVAQSKLEVFREEKTAYFIDCINNTNSSDSITRERTGWLAHAEKAKDLDEINEEQFMKIMNVAENRIAELEEGIV